MNEFYLYFHCEEFLTSADGCIHFKEIIASAKSTFDNFSIYSIYNTIIFRYGSVIK